MVVMLAVIGLVLLALGVGFFGGYVVVARGGQAGSPAGYAGPVQVNGHQHGPSQPCAFELPEKDAHVLAGLTCNCNEPHCNRTLLLACHCSTAHSMKSMTKELLSKGMGKDEIVLELEKRWGPGLRPGT